MDIKALRQKVLDLAIRGKLVPQNPDDEPASVLLEKIRQEKEQMVKEGKLKKKDIKDDTVIFKGEDGLYYEQFKDGKVKCINDEIPFEVPEGWEWCRLSLLGMLISGRDLKIEKYNDIKQGIPYITGASNFIESQILINRWTEKPQVISLKKDILITCKGTIGEIAINNIGECHIARQIMALRINDKVNLKFIVLSLKYYLKKLREAAKGLIPGVTRNDVLNLFIPLPSLNEQQRIVEKIESIFKQIDILEHEKEEVQSLIKLSKNKLLDLAIRGQLVPQDTNDEPASVLLEKIREEKEQLIKEGKLKPKDIKDDTIIFKGEDGLYYEQFKDGKIKCINDEIPFEIPEWWQWCRLKDIVQIKGGKRLPKGTTFSLEKTKYIYLRVTDMKDGSITKENLKYITIEIYEKIKQYTISKSDLYISIAGTIGEVGEIPDDLDGANLTENALRLYNITVNKKFLCLFLRSNFVQNQFKDKTHHVAMPKLALSRVAQTLVCIPNLKEQQRIVEKLEQLFAQIDRIEINLQ